MHILQPKHFRIKSEELKKLVDKYNISVSQLPAIKLDDPALPERCVKGDVIRVERKEGDKVIVSFRVVI